ncbi:MAG: RHS repeat-associated core domain-containing protein [Gammaproteobacteria bacterium]|nr:MAG: RHS repeat-associated core domain-containing protein [Gammaproteobacteria bacterium]
MWGSMMDAFGLMYYNARWHDPSLGRFAQADTIIPGAGSPLAWDRYAYVNDNPLRYRDPSGHKEVCGVGVDDCESPKKDKQINGTPTTITFDTNDIVDQIPGTAEQWGTASLLLDEVALAYDTALGIYVLCWTGIGALGGLTFEGNPVTGAFGAAAGYIIGEGSIYASGALFEGNLISSTATLAGLISDMKNGNTHLQGTISITSDNVRFRVNAQVSSGALTSMALSGIGWGANLVALSLPLQAMAVVNDKGWLPSANMDLTFP